MNEQTFIDWCKEEIVKYTIQHLSDIVPSITVKDIYVVWCCKTLQNNKALLATRFTDNMYYECTYNGDRKEMYIDAYEKHNNIGNKAIAFVGTSGVQMGRLASQADTLAEDWIVYKE